MKLAPDIAARVLLGEKGIACPVCHWPLKVWSKTEHYPEPVATCWTAGCLIHERATRERIDGGERNTFSYRRAAR